MLFPFYWDEKKQYTINDADYDCGRVIVAECDNSHRYATLCELIEDCPAVRQLTRNCIVEALNNLTRLPNAQSIDPSHRFLKVTPDGCLEIADPCICNEWDKYVIATENDNHPGPLSTKVRWACSYDWLYCIDIEVGWPNLLVWRPSGPNGPFTNPATPTSDCDDVYVKLKKNGTNWVVDYECLDDNKRPQYCYCQHKWWMAAKSCKWKTIQYYAVRSDCTYKPNEDDISYINNWREVRWTEAFGKPDSDSWAVVNINQPWQYAVSFFSYIQCMQTNNAIRVWIYTAHPGERPQTLWDIKYEAGEMPQPWRIGWDPLWFNRMHPYEFDREAWTHSYEYNGWTIEHTWIPFANNYIINVNTAPLEICFVVKPDMRYTDPRVPSKREDPDSRYIFSIGDPADPHSIPATIAISRIGDPVPENRLSEI